MLTEKPDGIRLTERMAIRFGATFLANLLRACFSFASGILIARALGASRYGDLSFLLGSFAAISQLMEMGTSSAFYTFISKRRQSGAFFAFYFAWVVFQFVVTVVLVGLLLPVSVIGHIWVGHERSIVLLAFMASFVVTQVWGIVCQLGEAIRKTVLLQVAAVGQAVMHLALVAAAVHWEWLTVQTVMWLLVGEHILLTLLLAPIVANGNLIGKSDSNEGLGTITSEWVAYCKPLAVYGWVGFLYLFADRWLLQHFAGSEQQGFFAVGQQFANISLIATTSILMVFWKEVAEARERQDHRRVQALYTSVSRGLYFVGAWLSCLLIPYSREILTWTVGAGYETAWLCLALMFLFPVHQSLGQIHGAFFYASGETGSYARIGLLMMAVSIPLTYLVLAPGSAAVAGLGLGAVGLALKMVGLQVVGVNIQAYMIAQTNRWNFTFAYQGLALGVLLCLGWASKWASQGMLDLTGSVGTPGVVMLLGCGLYISSSLAFLSHFPQITGLSREQVRSVLTALAGRPRPAVA